jgi:hypothetical protein
LALLGQIVANPEMDDAFSNRPLNWHMQIPTSCRRYRVQGVMMDIDDVIKDGVPMQQFIGPINTGTS